MALHKMARVRVSMALLEKLIIGDLSNLHAMTTAPDDLTVVGVSQPHHAIGSWFYAIIESKSFKPVPEGAEIPIIEPFIYIKEFKS